MAFSVGVQHRLIKTVQVSSCWVWFAAFAAATMRARLAKGTVPMVMIIGDDSLSASASISKKSQGEVGQSLVNCPFAVAVLSSVGQNPEVDAVDRLENRFNRDFHGIEGRDRTKNKIYITV